MDNKTVQGKLIKERNIIYFIIKRFFDIFLSFIALILLSPIFLIVMIAIKLTSKGPIFFKHKRIGKNHQEIGIWKFRTMVVNAEKMIEDFTPEQKEEYEKNFKLENDPRITKIGNVLRKTSLDELPQLINILGGSMSIVGPRPVVEDELHFYGDKVDDFLSVTPGLTGLWACSGRSDIPYDERVKLELYYVNHASIGLDLMIIFKTFWSVLKREGAK